MDYRPQWLDLKWNTNCPERNFPTKLPEFLFEWKAQTRTGNLFENLCRYKKTVPQLLIRWSLQKDFITIPKSSKPERIQENADIFDFTISAEDMKTLVGFIKITAITDNRRPFSSSKLVARSRGIADSSRKYVITLVSELYGPGKFYSLLMNPGVATKGMLGIFIECKHDAIL